MKLKSTLGILVASILVTGPAHAAIVNNLNGTFTDTATGDVWQNVSTFYNLTYAQDQSLVLPGFSFASQSQVDQLEADTGLNSSTPDATFIAVAAAMGVPTPTPYGREIIWGMYGDGSNWAYIYGPQNSPTDWTDAPSYVNSWPDEGAFVIMSGGGVPEPAGWALMLVGVGGLGVALRGRARRLTA